ncbi:hypothetical protein EYF80_045629 [Liparis tanakae]|uniref:Uncharacterized protein n=1 Tax=Liparis tanakae TaxID=230148 RepID=A0A4Z2FTY0_9TELE|nr:hypothetical protein EYF80_045629 [Liparis tanakae]
MTHEIDGLAAISQVPSRSPAEGQGKVTLLTCFLQQPLGRPPGGEWTWFLHSGSITSLVPRNKNRSAVPRFFGAEELFERRMRYREQNKRGFESSAATKITHILTLHLHIPIPGCSARSKGDKQQHK